MQLGVFRIPCKCDGLHLDVFAVVTGACMEDLIIRGQ